MKKLSSLFIFTIFCMLTAQSFALNCNKRSIPKFIKKIEDYDIIATNTAFISTNDVFNGEHLAYSVTAKPHNKKNKVTINHQTGKIRIQADEQDNFDVKVTAKNHCGKASTKFNVQIDEET